MYQTQKPMYQIPKPPNQPNPKDIFIILAGIGFMMLYNRYQCK